jgi:hypothetical protein
MWIMKYIFKDIFWNRYFDLVAWLVLLSLFFTITSLLWQGGVLLRVWNAVNTLNSVRSILMGGLLGLVAFQVFSVFVGLWRLLK